MYFTSVNMMGSQHVQHFMDLPVKESRKMTCIYVETCSLGYNTIKYLCLTYHCSTSLVLSKRNVMYSIKFSISVRNALITTCQKPLVQDLLLGTFADVRNGTICFVMSVCPSTWKRTRLPLDGFSQNFMSEYFSKIRREISHQINI